MGKGLIRELVPSSYRVCGDRTVRVHLEGGGRMFSFYRSSFSFLVDGLVRRISLVGSSLLLAALRSCCHTSLLLMND